MKGKFGRCGISGHGQDCHVSREIQSTPTSRTTEKANAIRQGFAEMDDYKENLKQLENEDKFNEMLSEGLTDLYEESHINWLDQSGSK